MAKNQRIKDELPGAELIDAIGEQKLIEALGLREKTIQRWRKDGIPNRYKNAVKKLSEGDAEATDGQDEAPVDDKFQHDSSTIQSDLEKHAHSVTEDDDGRAGRNGRPIAESIGSPLPELGVALSIAAEPEPEPEPAPKVVQRPDDTQSATTKAEEAPTVVADAIEGGRKGAAERRRSRRRQASAEEQPSGMAQPTLNWDQANQRTTAHARANHVASDHEDIAPVTHDKKPVRLNRQTVVITCAVLVSAIGLGLANGLETVSSAPVEEEEFVEELDAPQAAVTLPKFNYADVTKPRPPVISQAAVTAVTKPPEEEEAEPEPQPEKIIEVQARPARAAQPQISPEDQVALESGLFPGGGSVNGGGGGASAEQGAGSTPGVESALASIEEVRNSIPSIRELVSQGQGQAGGLGQAGSTNPQQSFLTAQLDQSIYLQNGLQKPLSEYEVKAGTVIPAALVTGLNSDLPGEIIGQVTEHIYDTSSGQHLLIPQGAKIFGRYNAQVNYGQSRAQVVWDRLIMPNGNSVQLEAMVGTDKAGYAGLADQVDNHLGRLIGAVILSSFISVGANLATDSGDGDVTDALGDAAAQQAAQVGGEIVNRQLNIQPTITVRPGFKLNILVNKDMILEPYQAS